ncbi:hypothetical protein EMCG_02285 [[Emmonsia] crescens]|uniref:Dickkopf N-terminal cysteine-rich domain-containing protein n=1 Tax=[Emmonsia] crescens TaxID=73230 RepID=A0A0G2HZ87_9EURO|nr:hypothetical protein EMCG_02285 [Emmonsia crescens UAMH 3008]
MKIDLPLTLALMLATTGTNATPQRDRMELCREGRGCTSDVDCQADKDCQKKSEVRILIMNEDENDGKPKS